MADEPPAKRIHFGGLDKVVGSSSIADQIKTTTELGVRAGNINISTADAETHDFSESAKLELEKQAKLLQQLEARRKKAKVVVPVNDEEVKLQLRSLGHPICLFGERQPDRSDRLRMIIASSDLAAEELAKIQAIRVGATATGTTSSKAAGEGTGSGKPKKQTEMFYTPATEGLVKARAFIAKYSWERGQQRLAQQRKQCEDAAAFKEQEARVHDVYSTVKVYRANASQFSGRADGFRPLTCCSYSYDQEYVVTGSLDMNGKLWKAGTCEAVGTLEGHTERIHDAKFRPVKQLPHGGNVAAIATGSADKTIKLWSLPAPTDSSEGSAAENKEDERMLRPIATLEGHVQRLSKLAWHPSGKYLGSTSYDHTWRLWDVEACQELLLQEGHVSEVYGIGFQKDGSLCASGDLAGIGRVWDLRSGKSVYALIGHARQILSVDFSPNGYQLATGSGDHSARIWDLRMKKTVYAIAGHKLLVSTVKFSPDTGSYLATSSYDKTVKIWSTRNWTLLKTLTGHDNKVTEVDISQDEKHLVTTSHDKTWKTWAHEMEF